jgi:hypothetical protein
MSPDREATDNAIAKRFCDAADSEDMKLISKRSTSWSRPTR